MIFVNSMSDLFHEEVPSEYIKAVFDVMKATPRHIYQVLTKRSKRLAKLAASLSWPENVWMGVTVENNDVIGRIRDLVSTGAFLKFISFEPMLEAIPDVNLELIEWVIVGGESGPHARGIKKAWIESIHEKCLAHRIPFFFKQWGSLNFNADPNDPTAKRGHKFYAKGGCQLDGRLYREMPIGRLTNNWSSRSEPALSLDERIN